MGRQEDVVICIWTDTTREIKLGGRELTLEIGHRCVALRRAATSPVTPRFDCEPQSRFLSVTVHAEAAATGFAGEAGQSPSGARLIAPVVEVAGLELRRGRAPHGGFLSLRGGTSGAPFPAPGVAIVVRNMTFADGAATSARSNGCDSFPYPRFPRPCFSGGGAISSDNVSSLVVEQVRASRCATENAGGFLAARGVREISLTGLTADDVRAGTFGGGVSLWSGARVLDGEWSVSGATVTRASAGEGGGAISLFAADNVGGNASWAVSDTILSYTTTSIGGGGIAFNADHGVSGNASWAVSGTSLANAIGGGITLFARNDVHGNASWSVSSSSITNSSWSGVSFTANCVHDSASWSVSGAAITNASTRGYGGGIAFLAQNGVDGNATWSVSDTAIAGAIGGGILFSSLSDALGDTSWSVSNSTVSDARVSGDYARGGAISFYAYNHVKDNVSWSVSDTTITNATVAGYGGRGGGISFQTYNGDVSGSASWSVAGTDITNASVDGDLGSGGGNFVSCLGQCEGKCEVVGHRVATSGHVSNCRRRWHRLSRP